MGRYQDESCCTCRKLVSGLVTLALVATGVGLAVYYLVPGGKEYIDTSHLPQGLEDLPKDLWDYLDDILLFNRDSSWGPGMQQNPDEANKWQSNSQTKSGLTLELRNALSEEWYTYFEESISDWDNGSPDALTLKTSQTSYMPDCPDEEADGIMLVCNDDYGETDWKGINKVLLQNGWIIASTARMNDRFFSAGGDAEKRLYTMCHEIGHGFGLAHTDESFWNRDLGNCLDYTTRYEGNKRPDQGNYEFLAALYGTVGGSSGGSVTSGGGGTGGGSSGGTGGDNINSGGEDPSATFNSNNGGRKRQLRQQQDDSPRRRRGLFHDVSNESRRRQLLADLKQVDHIVDRGLVHGDPRWRLLHKAQGVESHAMDLGEGYSVQVHLLHA